MRWQIGTLINIPAQGLLFIYLLQRNDRAGTKEKGLLPAPNIPTILPRKALSALQPGGITRSCTSPPQQPSQPIAHSPYSSWSSHQHWWDSFTCSDSFGSIAYNIFWRRYKLSFQRLAAWICFTLNMRLHSPLLVSFFFFLNKSKSRDFTGDPSCLLQGCLQWHSLRV